MINIRDFTHKINPFSQILKKDFNYLSRIKKCREVIKKGEVKTVKLKKLKTPKFEAPKSHRTGGLLISQIFYCF